jgi:broad specificity phosphatase PhoE
VTACRILLLGAIKSCIPKQPQKLVISTAPKPRESIDHKSSNIPNIVRLMIVDSRELSRRWKYQLLRFFGYNIKNCYLGYFFNRFNMFVDSSTIALNAGPHLFLVRHGESDHNVKKVCNSNPSLEGYFVSNLTEKGIAQIHSAAKQLQTLGISFQNVVKAYISPLPRTQQSAQILLESGIISKEKMEACDEIREPDARSMEGKLLEGRLIEITDSNGVKRLTWDESDWPGETNAELDKRVLPFLKQIGPKLAEGHIIMVTHSAIIERIAQLRPKEGNVVCLSHSQVADLTSKM